mmetsp:Transcript_41161/g.132491  ORF Transcript_41161/g.132491 Transcript_41161/m.132491 type:complete len:938 (-) Transcript_41161:202-3015(-)
MGWCNFCSPKEPAPPARKVDARPNVRSTASKQRIELNVGGQRYTTSRATLESCPNSHLARLIEEEPEEDGVYFLDRDGRLFSFILNFLRDGTEDFVLPTVTEDCSALRREAKQLGLDDLVALLSTTAPSSGGEDFLCGLSTVISSGGADASTLDTLPPPPPEEHSVAEAGEGDAEYLGAPLPCNELKRLAKLKSLDVLYSSREQEYDNVTSIVAALLEVPIVIISLVAKDEQWFKSKTGLSAESTPRNVSFCAFMLKPEATTRHAMLVVEDAERDPRVWNNPLVTGEPFVRFYAGSPLVTSEGMRLGALCAIDRVPRSLTPAQAQVLVNFAQLAVTALERRQLDQQQLGGIPEEDEDGAIDFAAGPRREQRMRESLSEIVVLVWARPDSNQWPMLYASKSWTDMTGIIVAPPPRFPGEVKLSEMSDDGTPSYAQLPNSLWEYLEPASSETGKFQKLQKAVSTTMMQDASAQQPTVSLSADLRVKNGVAAKAGPGSGPTKHVLCRFTPASMPLDVAAAAIKPSMHSSQINANMHPKGFPAGLLYFCVMMVQEAKPPERSEPQPQPQLSPSAAEPAISSGAMPSGDLSSTFAANGCKRLDLTNLRQQAQAAGLPKKPVGPGAEDMIQARASVATTGGGWRPPVSPYEDVRVLRMAGEGSFGKVYFGLWNGMAVAVKVISNMSNTQQKLTLSPDVEAELSSLVSHQNLVKTFQYCTRMVPNDTFDAEDEAPREKAEMWIVQEWCDGGTLRKFCKQPRVEGEGILEAVEIGLEIARGIEYLHSKNVIHGDLTPNNVMLKSQSTRKGYVCKVCDFGRARIFDSETQEIMTRTMGTVTHMPPELFVTNIDSCCLTPKADVYALGVVLYEVVAGKTPFSGLSPPQVVLRVASGKRLEMPREVTPELVNCYRACVARQPQDRPSSSALVETLEAFYQKCQSGNFA